MPRPKNKRTPEQSRQVASERDQALATLWCKYLRSAMKAKEKFTAAAKEVDLLFDNGSQRGFFESPELKEAMNLEGVVASPVNLAFQIRGWIGPGLYHRNPTRNVTVRTRDGVLVALARATERYLNYTPNETGLARESRRGIDESLLAGRGVLYTGIDPTTKLVTSWQISVDDVLIDPDAKTVESALWIAWRRRVPLWQAKKEYGEPARELKADRVSQSAIARDSDDEPEPKDQDSPEYGVTNDLVTIYEVYSKMGLGWKGHGCPEQFRHHDDANPYRKITLVMGYPRPLEEGKWEAPLYLDRDWPFSFLDLTPERRKLWPISLMGAGMPHQKVINLLSSLATAKAKALSRDVYVTNSELSRDQQRLIANGPVNTFLSMGGKGDQVLDVRQVIQKFEQGAMSPELMNLIYFHRDQFGQTTGLLPILMGGGEGEQQSRSATESDIKDRNARSRVTDMSERVEDWHSQAARHEGIMIRLELDAEEVERIVGGPADAELGWLISLEILGAEVPVRTRPSDKQIAEGQIDLEQLYGPAGQYFDSEEEATAAAAQLAQALMTGQINMDRAAEGLPPVLFDPTKGDTLSVRQVTVRDVWRDTAYLSVEDVVRELAFRIEAGSTKRPDPNAAIDRANTIMANAGQVALNLGDFATYNRCLKAVYDAQQVPVAERVYLTPPAPNVLPGGAPAGEQKGAGGVMDGTQGFSMAGGGAPVAKVGA